MNHRRALVISLIIHAIVFVALASGISFSQLLPKKHALPIEARVVIKQSKNKDHLPRKSKAAPLLNDDKKDPKEQKKSEQPQEKLEKVAETIKAPADSTKKASAKKTHDYTKALASLSNAFAQDLAAEVKEEEPEGEVVADDNYFDQVYALIKSSFVVPPHINGPQGKDLQTIVKLFLASDGSLLRIDLLSPSGDDHFDKAVLEGTRRVDNFGMVPPTLQNMVRERGIVVELCPFTCKER